ncbi:MAG: ATP-binding protein [Acidobacteriaceae bacterium]
MMPALLPIAEKHRQSILELSQGLQPYVADIAQRWRRQMFDEFQFDGRAMAALERLNLGTGFGIFAQNDFEIFAENLQYFGTRLAKLQIDTRAVARSLELYQETSVPFVQQVYSEAKSERLLSALQTLSSATFVAVSGAYFDTQNRASAALLALLDAELSAQGLPAILERVLEITTRTFAATVGVILLLDPESALLRVKAAVGLGKGELDDNLAIELGRGFTGQIAESGEPGILPDLNTSAGLLNPVLKNHAKSLWGMPLKANDRVIGVIAIGFERPYQWLPTERELLRAIADRSALAIDRASIMDAVREREIRIAELSGHLLKAQEEERKRISRELHDETGQALMVIRLYLGMLESTVTGRTPKAKIHELLDVVDRTIEGIRRIIARLSPLLLQELGMVAAIRKEAKDLARNTGVKTEVMLAEDVGRLAPEVETAIYRVVQEALHNIAKHAHARTVNVHVTRDSKSVRVLVEDDGIGIAGSSTNPQRRTFGLAGMRERITALGGTIRVHSRKGQGTRITVNVPVPQTHEAAERTKIVIPSSRAHSVAGAGID